MFKMSFFKDKNTHHRLRYTHNTHNNHQRNRSSILESQSPHGKIKGTCAQLVEKYMGLGRDALRESDGVLSETFFQYAEHYRRLAEELARFSKPTDAEKKDEEKPLSSKEEVEQSPPAEQPKNPEQPKKFDKEAAPKEREIRRYRVRRPDSAHTPPSPGPHPKEPEAPVPTL